MVDRLLKLTGKDLVEFKKIVNDEADKVMEASIDRQDVHDMVITVFTKIDEQLHQILSKIGHNKVTLQSSTVNHILNEKSSKLLNLFE